MYANRMLFSDELFAAYEAYMVTLFAMYASTDADAQVRAPIAAPLGNRRNLPWWEDGLEGCFDTADPATREEIRAAYEALGQWFRADMFVTHTRRPLLSSPPPA